MKQVLTKDEKNRFLEALKKDVNESALQLSSWFMEMSMLTMSVIQIDETTSKSKIKSIYNETKSIILDRIKNFIKVYKSQDTFITRKGDWEEYIECINLYEDVLNAHLKLNKNVSTLINLWFSIKPTITNFVMLFTNRQMF